MPTTLRPKFIAPDDGLRLQSGPGRDLVFKLTGDETGGAFDYFVVEVASHGGPPLHVHHEQEESLHVLSGRFKVRVGEEEQVLAQGGFAFMPSGRPHAFLNLTDEPAEIVVVAEFDAWRGLIRLRESVMREVDQRLDEAGEISLDDYGVLITLVGQPDRRLRMSALGARRLLTPSGISRAVMRLEERGLVRREPDPDDRRASFAALTPQGLAALRRAQRVHHATVRELYLDRLIEREQRQLARLFEKALPGVVSSPEWPPPR